MRQHPAASRIKKKSRSSLFEDGKFSGGFGFLKRRVKGQELKRKQQAFDTVGLRNNN